MHYFANGGTLLSSKRINLYCDGVIIELDNFREMKGCGRQGLKSMNRRPEDKHNAAQRAWERARKPQSQRQTCDSVQYF